MILQEFNYKDCVYYSKEYVSLYLKEKDKIFEFSYKEDDKEFYNISIKRPIEDTGYFDLETAYGYGGWFSNTNDEDFLNRAIKNYQEKCLSENIVAEFIRFHPFNKFPQQNKDVFDFFRYDRDVVVVDLTKKKEERWKDYSSNTKSKINRARKYLEFNLNCDMESFIRHYYFTMNKNKASKFYYFTKSYFSALDKMHTSKVFCIKYNNEIVSMAVFLESKYIVSYHLGATNYDILQDKTFFKYSNYFLFENVFEYYSNINKKYAILGGGRTSSKDDSLLKFKQKFSKKTLPFYIAGKIFNKDAYNVLAKTLCKNNKLFLKWRNI